MPDLVAEFETANVTGTIAVIAAMRAKNVKRLVFVSSLSAREPQLSAYGASKARAEQALEVLQALYEMASRPIPEEQVQLMMAGDTALRRAPDGAAVLATRRADLRARTHNQGHNP